MIQQFLAQRDLISWPLVALVIFFMTFAAVLLYVVLGLKNHRDKVDYLASLPFADDGDTEGKEESCRERA